MLTKNIIKKMKMYRMRKEPTTHTTNENLYPVHINMPTN